MALSDAQIRALEVLERAYQLEQEDPEKPRIVRASLTSRGEHHWDLAVHSQSAQLLVKLGLASVSVRHRHGTEYYRHYAITEAGRTALLALREAA